MWNRGSGLPQKAASKNDWPQGVVDNVSHQERLDNFSLKYSTRHNDCCISKDMGLFYMNIKCVCYGSSKL